MSEQFEFLNRRIRERAKQIISEARDKCNLDDVPVQLISKWMKKEKRRAYVDAAREFGVEYPVA